MKHAKGSLTALLLSYSLLFAGCTATIATPSEQTESDSSAKTDVLSPGSNTSATESTPYAPHSYTGTETFSNRTLSNGDNRMGDQDGPAYCVYSKQGYTAVSMVLELSQLDLNIYRQDQPHRHVNAYIFLGADTYDPETGNWMNCADAGLVYSGSNGWHIFYNLFTCADPEQTPTWYESEISLNAEHDYRLSLNVSHRDGRATLSVYDLNIGVTADRISFELYGAKKDGSNVSFLTNFALDYPENLRLDTTGAPSTDWVEITRYNTDQGIYLKNIRVHDCTLYQGETAIAWTTKHTQNRGIWPDADISKLDYPCTTIRNAIENTEYIVDLDLNHP